MGTKSIEGTGDNAMAFFKKAEQAYDAVDAKSSIAYSHMLRSTGQACESLGNREEALDFFQRSATVLEGAGATRLPCYARVLYFIGKNHMELNDNDKAFVWLQKCEEAHLTAGTINSEEYLHHMKRHRLLDLIGRNHMESNNNDEAFIWLQKYEEWADHAFEAADAKSSTEYSHLLRSMGQAWESMGNRERALALFERSAKVLEEAGAKSV